MEGLTQFNIQPLQNLERQNFIKYLHVLNIMTVNPRLILNSYQSLSL